MIARELYPFLMIAIFPANHWLVSIYTPYIIKRTKRQLEVRLVWTESDPPLALLVSSHSFLGEALLFDAQGSEVSGVLTYCIPSIDETLAVMFFVGSSRNLWKVKLYSGLQRASSQMYRQMYNDQPVQGDDQWHLKYLWPRLAAWGYMSSSREATLQIQILLQAPRRGPWVKG